MPTASSIDLENHSVAANMCSVKVASVLVPHTTSKISYFDGVTALHIGPARGHSLKFQNYV